MSKSIQRAARGALAAVFAASILSAGCSGQATDAGEAAPPESAPPADARSAPAIAKAPPAVAPELPIVADRDRNHDRIDDAFASSDASAPSIVELEVILTAPAAQAQLDAFVQLGGRVRHVFGAVSHGWTGSIARDALPALRDQLGVDLHLIAAPKPLELYLDEATRTGRVRPIWASSFAGLTSGASGNANITIAVVDTGVDDTHTDLAGRMIGWKDYTADNSATAGDVIGHGTHVASIALGSGAAFGLGPGTLRITNSGTLASTASNGFLPSPIHTPSYFGGSSTLTVTSAATFLGGVSATLAVVTSADAGGWSSFGSSVGASPRSIGSISTSNGAARYSNALQQTNPAGVTLFSVNDNVANYPAVGDGFNALRGVAPSCKWFGAKVFNDAGAGNTGDIGEALDDLVTMRVASNIKIVNMSLGVTTGADTTLRAKVNSAVNNGIVVVVAAGNSGPSGTIADPGLANKVLTVGASNDKNELTTYTSVGAASIDATTTDKPDLLAPGGSVSRSQILAADTNTKDAASTTFADTQSNDYSGKQGTSMAAPFAAGAAALLIDAMQQSGTTWTASSSAQPLLVKMLLLASATETNANREQSAGSNPTLGRASAPRDLFEGFGILNPDAAIEAFTTALPASWTGSVSNTSPARLEWERRAWGRKVSLVNGAHLGLTLTVPSTADLDLSVYSGAADGSGVPVLRASSTTAALDSDETISFTSTTTETAYVFVKRISGYGAFTLASTTTNTCGNGTVESGEECDPGSGGATTCCSATCQAVTAGTTCSDGNACTQTDTCQAGVCVGASPKTCSASDQCHDAGTCNTSTGACSNPAKTNGTTCSDGNACTQTDTCQAGTCTGSNAKTCAASDQCHDAGTCNTSTGACSNPTKTNGTTCSDGNACTQTDTCQAGTCTGSNAKTCAASDQCHDAGTCNTGTGACSNPAKTNGTTCSDGNACTQTDTCQSGTCTGASPKTCAASDQCHDAGTCNPSSGACSNPAKIDGSGCSDGNACTQTDTCQAGTCSGANPTICAALDQCHDAGTCNPSSGACSTPVKANGTTCNDGNACTQTDSCQAGTCTGGNLKTCAASDQCHDAGSCDTGTGACSNPAKTNGATCTDGNACTQSDSCQSGACVGANPVTCSAASDCQLAGTCAPATGQCSAPLANDGTPCSNGTCSSGLCMAAGGAGAGGGGGAANGGGGATNGGEANAGAGAANGGEASGGEASGGGGAANGGEAGAVITEPGAGGDAGEPGVAGRAGASVAGESAVAGGSSGGASNGQDSGCGCSEAGSAPRAPLAWGALLALVALTVSRRRPRLSAE